MEEIRREVERRRGQVIKEERHQGIHQERGKGISDGYNVSPTRPAPRRRPDTGQDGDE